MENEAFEQISYMAWVLYLCFFLIGLGQILLFCLYNNKYHPFNAILKGVKKQGNSLFLPTCSSNLFQILSNVCLLL